MEKVFRKLRFGRFPLGMFVYLMTIPTAHALSVEGIKLNTSSWVLSKVRN